MRGCRECRKQRLGMGMVDPSIDAGYFRFGCFDDVPSTQKCLYARTHASCITLFSPRRNVNCYRSVQQREFRLEGSG